jgi:hypothetical protein
MYVRTCTISSPAGALLHNRGSVTEHMVDQTGARAMSPAARGVAQLSLDGASVASTNSSGNQDDDEDGQDVDDVIAT